MRSMLGVADNDYEDEVAETTSGPSAMHLLASLSFAAIGLAVLMGGQLLSESSEVMLMEEVDFEPLAIEPSNEPVLATDQPSELILDDGAPDTIASILGSGLGSGLENTLGSGPRRIKFRGIPDPVDVKSMPVLGSSDATHMVVEAMDYTCSHCRKLHSHLQGAVDRYGDQIGVAIYHVPLSKKCNPHVRKDYPGKKNACDYAQLAIGVWKLSPEKFHEFHAWLLAEEKPPSVVKARQRAMRLVGSEVLLDKKVKAETTRRLAKQSTMIKRLKTGLPILLLENGALRGVPNESQKIFDYFEKTLGVEAQ